MGLRNLPTDVARPLTSLIDDAEPGRVSSRSLTRLSDVCQIMLLSFAAGGERLGRGVPGGHHVLPA